jgi:DNA mismatch repair ATPase MutL
MKEEFKEYNVLEEELATVKSQKCGHGKFLSTDGHTFRVEQDATKKYVNFLFNEEVKEPITNEIERRVTKAAKRARQRLLMEEEMNELYMPQCMKPTTFQSTDTNIFKVERNGASKKINIMVGGEEPTTKEAVKRARQSSAKETTPATPAPEAAAKTGGSSDNCNSDEDEKPAAKAALAKAAPKTAAKMEDSKMCPHVRARQFCHVRQATASSSQRQRCPFI